MNMQTTGTTGKESPLIAFEDQLSLFCKDDKYREMAESFSSFVKSHNGISYLALEPIAAKVGAHLVKKTQAPSAFITMTLRRPTWTDELAKSLSDPEAFQTLIISLETEVLDIAKQTKKLS